MNSFLDNLKLFFPNTISDQPINPGAVDSENTQKSNGDFNISVPGNISSTPIGVPVVARELISNSLNTQTQQILGGFFFGRSGSIAIGNYQSGISGDIRISPNGIVGRNSSGVTTFSIDGTTGNATFLGTVAAGAVIAANINANLINAGDIASARMQTNVLTALKVTATSLSAISANIGSVTAGSITGITITGTTITGGTVRTAASGSRVEMSGSSNTLKVYNGSTTIIQMDSGGLLIKAGNVASFGSSGSAAQIYQNDETGDFLITNSGHVKIGSGSSSNVSFFTSANEQFRVSSDKNISYNDLSIHGELEVQRDYIKLKEHNSSSYVNVSFTSSGGDAKIYVDGNTKTAIMPTSEGYRALYCIESPEVWFMDFVKKDKKLDPLFEEVTEGECKFIKLQDGDYQVWRRRKGYINKRFGEMSKAQYISNKFFWGQAHKG
jgi:hypothetical protein